jgi:ribonuclease P protein component
VPNSLDHNRYGFIVSKRLGNAVVRNRVRRRLRACVNSLGPETHHGYDILFITRRPVLVLKYRELHAVVYELLQQAGLLEHKI